jgi:hypothetical protein
MGGMEMIRIIQKIAGVLLALATIVSFHSCAHKESSSMPDSEAEVWEMEIKGGTEAKYKVLMKRTEIEKDVYSIHGEFSGMAHDSIGGRGIVKCKFHGRITRNNLKADFSGRGEMVRSVDLKGSFSGTLSDSEGTGVYHVAHVEGHSDGVWTMKRIVIPK